MHLSISISIYIYIYIYMKKVQSMKINALFLVNHNYVFKVEICVYVFTQACSLRGNSNKWKMHSQILSVIFLQSRIETTDIYAPIKLCFQN